MKLVRYWQRDDMLGIALARPNKLNALSEEMVLELRQILEGTRAKEVILYGLSPRAFCAGGDVAQVITKAQEKGGAPSFFAHEYAADRSLWECAGRLSCLGHGVVMGGGFGLFAPGKNRVVSETTVAAMPEVTIGFFPDVGAHYFLRAQAGDELALFLALTGARLNAKEMLEAGLATHFVETKTLMELGERGFSQDQLDELSKEFKKQTHYLALENQVEHFRDEITQFVALQEVREMDEFATRICEGTRADWFSQAMQIYLAGSPTTKYLTRRLFTRERSESAAKALELDLKIAHFLVAQSDFKEGVRALLIDKDKNPSWQPLTNEIKKEIDQLLA